MKLYRTTQHAVRNDDADAASFVDEMIREGLATSVIRNRLAKSASTKSFSDSRVRPPIKHRVPVDKLWVTS